MRPETIDIGDLPEFLGNRSLDSHKGDYGHVLVIGGNRGMVGAPLLAAEAAARTGTGLISVATIMPHVTVAAGACREIMVHGIKDSEELRPLLSRASVIAIGPGLGRDLWSKSMFDIAMQFRGPVIVDADALHLLAAEPHKQPNRILTPHPGEAAALLGVSSGDIQSDRIRSVEEIQTKYGGVCVLKGMGTLIAATSALSICNAGNPGMASGGMGDTLTGIIAGLCAQGLDQYDASRFGVQLHAESADIAARDGMRGMLASDLFKPLRALLG